MTINPDVIYRKEFDGTGILYNTDNNDAFYLNKMCVLICDLLQEGKSRDEILSILPEKVTNLPDDIAVVLDNFIASLMEKGLFQN